MLVQQNLLTKQVYWSIVFDNYMLFFLKYKKKVCNTRKHLMAILNLQKKSNLLLFYNRTSIYTVFYINVAKFHSEVLLAPPQNVLRVLEN